MINMKHIVMAMLFALVSVFAAAQDVYKYEGDGFYLRLVTRNDVRIGSTSDMRFVTEDFDDNERKVEVKVLCTPAAEGYSKADSKSADFDFFINDEGTELMAEDGRETRGFLRELNRAGDKGAQLALYIEAPEARHGRKVSYIHIPAKVIHEMINTRYQGSFD